MARSHRKCTERPRNRTLWKLSWYLLIALLLLVASTLFVKFIKIYIMDSHVEAFPLNHLERSHVSRNDALKQLREFIVLVKQSNNLQQRNLTIIKHLKWRFAKQISRDVSIIQGLRLEKLASVLGAVFGDDLSGENSGAGDSSFTENSSESSVRHFVTHTLCYDNAFTPHGNNRHVDPSFCPRLIDLLNDIQQGLQPPLLTVFTWLPDPLVDVDRLRRRLLFQNLDLLRPIIRPVLITDSRVNMALANYYDWPCLPVASFSSDGIPVFRSMADTVSKQFNSTFYGYVKPTTVFDASLVETLLKLKEIYIAKYNKDSSFKWDSSTNEQSTGSARPVLVYGRALRASHVGDVSDLQHVSGVVNTTQSRIWADKKESLVYFFFAGVNFYDIPNLIVDDKYLTSLLVSRSMALGHLVVDASATIYCAHIFRDRNVSEWNRAYLYTRPRDPSFNKKLGGQYFRSLGLRKPQKWLNEVASKFSKSGSIFMDIRSQKSSEGQGEQNMAGRSDVGDNKTVDIADEFKIIEVVK